MMNLNEKDGDLLKFFAQIKKGAESTPFFINCFVLLQTLDLVNKFL